MATARAQQKELRAPAGDGPAHLGPVQVAPVVSLGDVGFDSNVFRSHEPISDFTTVLRPQALAWWDIASARITGLGSLDFVRFQQYATERSLDSHGRLDVRVPYHRVLVAAGVRSENLRQATGDEIDVRARRRESSGRIAFEGRVAPRTTIGVEWLRARTAYAAADAVDERQLQELLQHTSNQGTGYLRHSLSPITRLLARVAAEGIDFDFEPVRNARSLRIEGGLLFGDRGLLRGDFVVGVRRFDLAGQHVPDFTGVVANVDLQAIVGGSTSLGVRAIRDVDYSSRRLEPYFIRTSVGPSLLHRFDERWEAGGSVTFTRLAYQQVLGYQAPSGTEPREGVTTLTGRIARRLGPKVRLELEAIVDVRRSRLDPLRDYGRSRILTSFSYGFY